MSTEHIKQQLREETYNEAINLLQTYKGAVIVRPIGFGKRGIRNEFNNKICGIVNCL